MFGVAADGSSARGLDLHPPERNANVAADGDRPESVGHEHRVQRRVAARELEVDVAGDIFEYRHDLRERVTRFAKLALARRC